MDPLNSLNLKTSQYDLPLDVYPGLLFRSVALGAGDHDFSFLRAKTLQLFPGEGHNLNQLRQRHGAVAPRPRATTKLPGGCESKAGGVAQPTGAMVQHGSTWFKMVQHGSTDLGE